MMASGAFAPPSTIIGYGFLFNMLRRAALSLHRQVMDFEIPSILLILSKNISLTSRLGGLIGPHRVFSLSRKQHVKNLLSAKYPEGGGEGDVGSVRHP
jgi:hypothetical protein